MSTTILDGESGLSVRGKLNTLFDAPAIVDSFTEIMPQSRILGNSPTIVPNFSVAGAVTLDLIGLGSLSGQPIDYKESVKVATTANITLFGEQTIDGVLTSANRVLVKDQTIASQNGLWLSGAGAWVRTTDADISAEVTPGMMVPVEEGTISADLVYTLATNGTITLGSTALSFIVAQIPTGTFIYKAVAGTTYTTVLLDSQRWLDLTNAATKTLTIPPQSSVNASLNTEIWIFNSGAGLATIAAGAGVTIRSPASVLTLPQNYGCLIKKTANPNTWTIAQIWDRTTLKSGVSANLTAGFTGTAPDNGTKSSGTFTPDPATGNLQRYTNGGAHTLAPPSVGTGDSCQITMKCTNNGSAGTITTSGFTKVTGSALTTTNGHKFMFYITVLTGDSVLNVVALQ